MIQRCLAFAAILLVCTACADPHKEYIESYFSDPATKAFLEHVAEGDFDGSNQIFNTGLDINEIGSGGLTPLHWFLLNDRFLDEDKFRYLMELGPIPTIESRKLKRSSFHESARAENGYYLAYFLNEYGVDPNIFASDSSRPTALFFAVKAWNYNAIDLLVEAGADVNILNGLGENALVETTSNNWRSAYLLLQAGIDYTVPQRPSGHTIVWWIENNIYCPPEDGRVDWRKEVTDFLNSKGETVVPWQPPAE